MPHTFDHGIIIAGALSQGAAPQAAAARLLTIQCYGIAWAIRCLSAGSGGSASCNPRKRAIHFPAHECQPRGYTSAVLSKHGLELSGHCDASQPALQ